MTKFIHQYNDQILPSVWQLLTQTAEIYVKVVVNENDPNPIENDQEDDELNNFITLVLQLFEFIHSIVEKHSFRTIVKSVLTDLVYISIVYMQITEEQIISWSDDPELYVDDFNGGDIGECSIRASSSQLLTSIGYEFGAEDLLPALSEALSRHVQVAEAEKDANNPNWWKINEASITAIASEKKFISEAKDEIKSKFNLHEYLAYIKTMLGLGGNGSGYQNDISPYLHGKSLWTLCNFADPSLNIYDRSTFQSILDCMSNNLNGGKPMTIQICAIRSLASLCEDLKKASDEQRNMVIEKLPIFLNFIIDIGPRAKGSVLSDVLSTISSVAAV